MEKKLLFGSLVPDLIALQLAARQAHWAVRGPRFAMLHALFESLAHSLEQWVDRVAERLCALGGIPAGTLEGACSYASVGSFPLRPMPGDEALDALAVVWESTVSRVEEQLAFSILLKQEVTANMLTELQEHLELSLWHLQAHL